jgi:hypothetical protein
MKCIRGLLLRWSLAACVAVLLAACAASPYGADSKQRSDAMLQAQLAQAREALAPGQPPHVVFVGFALNAESRAFRGDVLRGEQVFRAIDPKAVVLKLSNPAFGQDADWPFATRENVAAVLQAIGPQLRAQDRAVLLFSSHGVPGALALRAGGNDIGRITAADLQQWLAPWRDKPTMVVFSACFSGSLMPPLRDPSRILMAAAAADRSSFGCQFHSERTFFIDALWPPGDLGRLSARELMDQARAGVQQREEALHLTPSQPRAFFGNGVQAWSRQPLAQWLQGTSP